jgi:hypothetical protein
MLKKTLKDILGVDSRPEARELSEKFKKDITEFLDDHKEFVVIIADKETDTIVVGYQEHLESNRIVDQGGSTAHIVSDMLKYNKDDSKIKDSINQFLLLIDGAIHDIAKRLKGEGNKEENKVEQK